MTPALSYAPPATLDEYRASQSVHNQALALKDQLDRLCRALHPSTPQKPAANRKLAASLSRDLQALRGRL